MRTAHARVEANEPANILIVDDRPENLQAFEATLEGLNQRIVLASSGPEALRFLLHHEVAVVLLDVQMPGMDGFETMQLIRQREAAKTIPIIFVTALNTANEHQVQFAQRKKIAEAACLPLYMAKCTELANYYFGFNGWTTKIVQVKR